MYRMHPEGIFTGMKANSNSVTSGGSHRLVQFDLLWEKYSKIQAETEKFRQLIENLKVENKMLQEDREISANCNTQLQQKIDSLSQNLITIKEQQLTHSDHLKEKNKDLDDKVVELKVCIQEKDQSINEIKACNKELLGINIKLDKEKNDLFTDKAELEELIQKYSRELESSKTKELSLQNKIKNLEDEASLSHHSYEKLSDDFHASMERERYSELKIKELEDKLNYFESELDKVTKKFEAELESINLSYHEQLKSHKKENNDLIKNLSSMGEELAICQDQLDQYKQNLILQNEQTDRHEDLLRELDTYKQKIISYQKNFEDKTMEMDFYKEEIGIQKIELASLNRRLEDKIKDSSDATSRIKELEGALHLEIELKESIAREKATLEINLERSLNEISSLKMNQQEIVCEKEALKLELADKEKIIYSLKKDCIEKGLEGNYDQFEISLRESPMSDQNFSSNQPKEQLSTENQVIAPAMLGTTFENKSPREAVSSEVNESSLSPTDNESKKKLTKSSTKSCESLKSELPSRYNLRSVPRSSDRHKN